MVPNIPLQMWNILMEIRNGVTMNEFATGGSLYCPWLFMFMLLYIYM